MVVEYVQSGGPLPGDLNLDGVVNGLDVDPFFEVILGSGVQAVPEPGSLAVAGLSAVLIIVSGTVVTRRKGQAL